MTYKIYKCPHCKVDFVAREENKVPDHDLCKYKGEHIYLVTCPGAGKTPSDEPTNQGDGRGPVYVR